MWATITKAWQPSWEENMQKIYSWKKLKFQSQICMHYDWACLWSSLLDSTTRKKQQNQKPPVSCDLKTEPSPSHCLALPTYSSSPSMHRTRFPGNTVGSATESFEQVVLAYKVAALYIPSRQLSNVRVAAHTICSCPGHAGMFPEMLMQSTRMEVNSSP